MSLRICRFGGTILPTRFMVKTYWAMGYVSESAGETRHYPGMATATSHRVTGGAGSRARRVRAQAFRPRLFFSAALATWSSASSTTLRSATILHRALRAQPVEGAARHRMGRSRQRGEHEQRGMRAGPGELRAHPLVLDHAARPRCRSSCRRRAGRLRGGSSTWRSGTGRLPRGDDRVGSRLARIRTASCWSSHIARLVHRAVAELRIAWASAASAGGLADGVAALLHGRPVDGDEVVEEALAVSSGGYRCGPGLRAAWPAGPESSAPAGGRGRAWQCSSARSRSCRRPGPGSHRDRPSRPRS